MSLLSKLFGGSKSSPKGPETIEYEGFRITPAPMKDGSDFRIAAKIEKEVGGELKTHQLIRADTMGGFDQAVEASTNKAKQMINEQGDRLFG